MKYHAVIRGATVLGIVLAGSSVSFGQTHAIASGNWTNSSTWSPAVPDDTPATTPTTIGGGLTVTIDSAGAVADLVDLGTVSGETGNLNISGDGSLVLSDTTAIADFSPAIRLGQAAGSTGNLTMSGGLVFIDGDGASVDPKAFARGDLLIGDNGAGTVTLTGGIIDANDEMFMAFGPASSATVNVSGGTLETLGRNILAGWAGHADVNLSGTGTINATGFFFSSFLNTSSSTITQTGGTLSADTIVLARTADSTYNHSSGTATSTVFVLADNFPDAGSPPPPGGVTGTYNISGDATLDVGHILWISTFAGGHAIVNQSGGTVNAGAVAVGREGTGTYNISSGVFHQKGGDAFAGNDHLVVGQDGHTDNSGQGTGLVNQTGGDVVVDTGLFLGDYDNSEGTYKISGGSLKVTGAGTHSGDPNAAALESFIGDLSIGGALASNAANAATRTDPANPGDAQGQALAAKGTFIVSGSGATEITVAQNLLANPADKHANRKNTGTDMNRDNSATLGFEIFDDSGTTLIDVAGVADLDGAVIDLDLMNGFMPTIGKTFDLLTASMFGATGTGTTQNVGDGTAFTLASEDMGSFSLAIVPGGNGKLLQATFLGAPVLQGDYNNNGVVDAADYVLWRKGGPLANDPTPGVQPSDYTFWRSHFGDPSGTGAGSSVGSGAAVPEPATWLLLVVGLAFGIGRSKRKN